MDAGLRGADSVTLPPGGITPAGSAKPPKAASELAPVVRFPLLPPGKLAPGLNSWPPGSDVINSISLPESESDSNIIIRDKRQTW